MRNEGIEAEIWFEAPLAKELGYILGKGGSW